MQPAQWNSGMMEVQRSPASTASRAALLHRHQHHGPVRQQRALGKARGAGGVEQCGDRIGIGRDRREGMDFRDEARIVVLQREDMGEQRQRWPQRRDVLEIGVGAVLRGADQHLRVRLLQRIGKVILAVMRVERHEDRAQRGAGHLHHGPFDAVLGQQRHMIASTDAARGQRPGQRQRLGTITGEAAARLLMREDQRIGVRPHLRRMLQRRPRMQHHCAHQPPSARRMVPVTKLAASDARNTAGPTISLISAMRRSGVRAAICFSASAR